jgi:hypothetical protein
MLNLIYELSKVNPNFDRQLKMVMGLPPILLPRRRCEEVEVRGKGAVVSLVRAA